MNTAVLSDSCYATTIQPNSNEQTGRGPFVAAPCSKRLVCSLVFGHMSLEALSWAIRQEVTSSSQKFVLILLGNYASDRGLSYPSIQTLAKAAALTDDTVRAALNSLVVQGLIEDTGKKAGSTQQIRVFRLPNAACSDAEKDPNHSGVKDPRKTRERPEKDPNPPGSPNIQGTGTGTVGVRAKAPRAQFVPPSKDECAAYAKKIGLTTEQSEAFRDHFTSNGWRVGRVGMKDWESAMRNWQRSEPEFSFRRNGHASKSVSEKRNEGMTDKITPEGIDEFVRAAKNTTNQLKAK